MNNVLIEDSWSEGNTIAWTVSFINVADNIVPQEEQLVHVNEVGHIGNAAEVSIVNYNDTLAVEINLSVDTTSMNISDVKTVIINVLIVNF